jgi:hypothetical protein
MNNQHSIIWTNVDPDKDDDFISKCSGLTLRVEEMSDGDWWWVVYNDKLGGMIIASSNGEGKGGNPAKDRKEALAKCEKAARDHLIAMGW